MPFLSRAENRFVRQRLSAVRHVTLDPDGPGVVRIHLVPCRTRGRDVPFIAILNGRDILPLTVSWAILLANLMDALQPYEGQELQTGQWAEVADRAVAETAAVYTRTPPEQIRADLDAMLDAFRDIATGQGTELPIRQMNLGRVCPLHGRPSPYGPDDQFHAEGRYLAVQPEMSALLCSQPALRRHG